MSRRRLSRTLFASSVALLSISGSLVALAPVSAAAGSCAAVRPSTTYAYANCSGVYSTGLIRVAVKNCSASGCYNTSGPWVYQQGGSRSEYRVGSGRSVLLRMGTGGWGYDLQGP